MGAIRLVARHRQREGDVAWRHHLNHFLGLDVGHLQRRAGYLSSFPIEVQHSWHAAGARNSIAAGGNDSDVAAIAIVADEVASFRRLPARRHDRAVLWRHIAFAIDE